MTRSLRTITVITSALVLVGAPAAADPAGPTHFRSSVTDIVGADDAPPAIESEIEVEVLGGDSFLVVRASPGAEVQVPGYEGEPYIRIAPDGTVEINTRSPARWLNDERFGLPEAQLPQQADADAPPTWELVARSGEYAWHDHRIHWMSPTLPPSVDTTRDEAQQVSEWSVPLVVDGFELTIVGELDWLPGRAPVIPVGALLLAAAAGSWLSLRRPSALPAAIAGGAAVAGALGVAASVGLPAGADVEPALVVLPGLALAVLVVARGWVRYNPEQAAWMMPAAALPLAVWGVVQAGSLTRPIVPGPVPGEVVLLVTALTIGIGLAAVVLIGRRILAATALDPDARDTND